MADTKPRTDRLHAIERIVEELITPLPKDRKVILVVSPELHACGIFAREVVETLEAAGVDHRMKGNGFSLEVRSNRALFLVPRSRYAVMGFHQLHLLVIQAFRPIPWEVHEVLSCHHAGTPLVVFDD